MQIHMDAREAAQGHVDANQVPTSRLSDLPKFTADRLKIPA
jgi:hypothetical protein